VCILTCREQEINIRGDDALINSVETVVFHFYATRINSENYFSGLHALINTFVLTNNFIHIWKEKEKEREREGEREDSDQGTSKFKLNDKM